MMIGDEDMVMRMMIGDEDGGDDDKNNNNNNNNNLKREGGGGHDGHFINLDMAMEFYVRPLNFVRV